MPDLVVAPPMSQTRQILQLMEETIARGMTPEELAQASPARLTFHQRFIEFLEIAVNILRANIDSEEFPIQQLLPCLHDLALDWLAAIEAGCADHFEDQALIGDFTEIVRYFVEGELEAMGTCMRRLEPRAMAFMQEQMRRERENVVPVVVPTELPMWGDESSDDDYHVDPNV